MSQSVALEEFDEYQELSNCRSDRLSDHRLAIDPVIELRLGQESIELLAERVATGWDQPEGGNEQQLLLRLLRLPSSIARLPRQWFHVDKTSVLGEIFQQAASTLI